MTLVNYSDSESDDENVVEKLDPHGRSGSKRKRCSQEPTDKPYTNKSPKSRQTLPPLPSKFHDLYASAGRIGTSDDPNLHDGRKRVIPHVHGNWATHVYLEWIPDPTEIIHLSRLLAAFEEAESTSTGTVHSLLTSPLGAQLPLHISLSRPVVLSTEQRQPFLGLLQSSIRTLALRPFDISFTGLGWVPNNENTRWFLVLRVARPPNDALNRLLGLTNRAVQENGQLPLYAASEKQSHSSVADTRLRGQVGGRGRGPGRAKQMRSNARNAGRINEMADAKVDCSSQFHVSIGWMLERPAMLQTEHLQAESGLFSELQKLRVRFDSAKVKIGNVITDVPLCLRTHQGGSLIGL